MVLYPTKAYTLYYTVIGVTFLLLNCIFLNDKCYMAALIFSLVYLVLFVPFVLATGKTVSLTRDGCEIRFLFYRRTYSWDDFKVKRVENYSEVLSYKRTYDAGIFFSVSHLQRIRWMGPVEQSAISHPLKTFFVIFHMEAPNKAVAYYPIPYEVDKNSFINMLSQWGIVLQHGE